MYPGTFAATEPDHPAVVMAGSGQVVTYGQLHDEASRLASCRFRGYRAGPG